MLNPPPRRLWQVETRSLYKSGGHLINILVFTSTTRKERKPSGSLNTSTCQQLRCKSRIAILGIPLQWSCLMLEMVFLASPRLPPPPTASRSWTGSGHVNVEGTKQRHPAILVHGLQLRVLLHPTDWNLYTALKRCHPASSWERAVRGVTVNTLFLSSSSYFTYEGWMQSSLNESKPWSFSPGIKPVHFRVWVTNKSWKHTTKTIVNNYHQISLQCK